MYTKLLQNLTGSNYIALMLMVALLSWSVALPTLLKAQAHDDIQPGPLDLQIILSDSAPGMTATHTISFKIATGTEATFGSSDTLTVAYQDAGSSASSTNADDNFTVTTANLESATVGGLDSTADWSLATSSNTLTFTGEASASLSAEDTVTFVVSGVVNPSYTLGFEDPEDPLWATTHEAFFTLNDSGTDYPTTKTRVAIIPAVTMTAAVDTIFTFSVAGLDAGFDINGRTTTGTSTPISFDFGTLAHDTEYFLGHELRVQTNASNGFVVTIQETQELTSSLGERIHRFQDTEPGGVGQESPIAWVAPDAELDDYKTYGHYGITTTDAELATTTLNVDDADFATGNQFVGNFHREPRPIFGHTGPTLSSYEHSGYAYLGVALEISSLQPAGDDYTNTLVYVATPTF